MNDQMSLFEDINAEEKQIYMKHIRPALEETIRHNHADESLLTFRQGAAFSSVYYGSVLICKFCQRKKTNFLSYQFAGFMPTKIDLPPVIDEYLPELQKVVEDAIWNYPADFGCCSHYVECSDKLISVQPDLKLSMGCQYKRNLYNGKVFYGKNKNIE